MSKAPTRNPVPMMPSQQLQRAANNSDNFAPIDQMKVPKSRSSQLLDTLNEVLPGVAEGLTNQIKRATNADKVRQENRALMNLAPTEDATKAGVKAHQAVGVRNEASESIRVLKAQADTFEGTDEEWEDVIASSQDRILQQLGGDANTIDAVGDIFREGLPQVADVRFKAQQVKDQQEKYRTTISSYADAANPSFTQEQVQQNLIQVEAESDAMGMSKEAKRKALVDASIIGAKNGDMTLLNYVKANTNWFDQEPGLIAANQAAIAQAELEQAGEIAIAKQGLVDQLSVSPGMTFEQFAMSAAAQTTAEGKKTWSEAEIRSAWGSGQKKLDRGFAVEDFLSTSLNRMQDETVDPVGFSLSTKEQRKLISKFDEMQAKQLIAVNNSNPQEKGPVMEFVNQQRNYKAKWLQENSLLDKKWEAQFKSLQSFDAESMEGDELPKQISSVLGQMDDLQSSPGALQAHADNTSMSIHSNFRKNIEAGMKPVQAYQAAFKQATSPPVRLSSTETKRYKKDVSSSVDAEFQSGFFSKLLGAPDDLANNQRREITSTVSQRALDLMAANVDQDVAIAQATEEYKATHTQLTNGTVVFGTRQQLGQRLGVPSDKVDGALVSLANRVSEAGLSNTDTPPEDWVMVVTMDEKGGLVRFKDKLGSYVTAPIALHEVGDISISEKTKKLAEEQDALRAKRLKYNEALKQAQQGGYSFEDPLGRF